MGLPFLLFSTHLGARGPPRTREHIIRSRAFFRLERIYACRMREFINQVINAIPITQAILWLDVEAFCAMANQRGVVRRSEMEALRAFVARDVRLRRLQEDILRVEAAIDGIA